MEIARWKFWAVIAALAVMIFSHIKGESTKVSPATGQFFHVVSVIIFISLIAGALYWLFKSWK